MFVRILSMLGLIQPIYRTINEVVREAMKDEILTASVKDDQMMWTIRRLEDDVVPPVGAIIAWVPRLTADSSHDVDLPVGWQHCDGSNIIRGPFAGERTPDLNNQRMFLRGGNLENILEFEESQLQDHHHVDEGHSHACSASSASAPHTHSYTAARVYDAGGYWGGSGTWAANKQRQVFQSSSSTVSVSTSCENTKENSNMKGVDVSKANAGAETRPVNMKVLYIIRVY